MVTPRPKAATDAADDYRRARARFCLRTGVAPSEYDNLTYLDINAFIEELNLMDPDS